MEGRMSMPIIPVRHRPATWNRSLPREWQGHEAITGADRKRPSRIRRTLKFAVGVLIGVAIFFLINFIFTPQFWAAVAGK